MTDERTIVLRGETERDRACAVIHGLPFDPKHPWEIVVRKHKKKRTLEQNKRYHAVCSEIAEQLYVDGRQYDTDTLKEFFKRMFIGSTEGTMPDGHTVQYGISTTTLDVGAFANFMTQIDVWASNHAIIFEETRAALDAYAEQAREWRERHKETA